MQRGKVEERGSRKDVSEAICILAALFFAIFASFCKRIFEQKAAKEAKKAHGDSVLFALAPRRELLLILFSASLCLCGSTLFFPATAQAAKVAGLPFVVGTLDSSKLDLSKPRLFVTPEQVKQARTRVETDGLLRGVRDRLVAEAYKELAAPRDPIAWLDESWWQAAKSKPWADTYPEVFLNTSVIPNSYAAPAATLATAWLLTGNDKYARQAVQLLMILAPYSFAAEHYDVGMNYSGFGLNVLRACDLLGSRFTADQRAALDGFMTRFAAAVARNDAYWIENNIGGGINNHLAWHKMTIGLLGLFYDRPDMVDYCMNGSRGLVSLLGDGLVDDGLWCESSLVYQFAAVAPMLIVADCQKRMGYHPGMDEVIAANGRALKQSFDAMFNVLAPNGLIPPIGDAYGSRTKLWEVPSYEYCWNLWGDSKYAWLIRQHPEPTSYLLFAPPVPAEAAVPSIGSILLPEHGYAFLRSHRDVEYWNNRDARCAMLTYDRSGVHANADKLSLMLFGRNRMLVSDVEGKATVPHAFSSKIQRELNRGGLCQNTVMIDGADQRCMPDMLDLIEFRDLPDEKRVTAADRRGILYDSVRQMRTIAMTPDYVLDVFQVDCGGKTRQIDWIAHVMDEKATAGGAGYARQDSRSAASQGGQSPPYESQPFEFPKTGAYPWLRDVRTVPCGTGILPVNEAIRLEWRGGDDRLGLRMPNLGFERLIFCGFPVDDKPDSAGIPMVMVRKQASRATFVAVWLVGGSVKDVNIQMQPDHEGKLVFEITAIATTRVRDLTIVRRHLVPKL